MDDIFYFIFLFSASIAAIAATILLTSIFLKNKRMREYSAEVDKARGYIEIGQKAIAIDILLGELKRRPSNADARYLLLQLTTRRSA